MTEQKCGKQVLVIGGGGREHALVWKLSQSPQVNKIYIAPGNGGTLSMSHVENVSLSSQREIVEFADNKRIDLTVVGPEKPLSEGIADLFAKKNLLLFGPHKKPALLEASKSFAKSLMKTAGIPSPQHMTFSDADTAKYFLRKNEFSPPYVIKADGLAAGKGVVICADLKEADHHIDAMLQGQFGRASTTILIEEFVSGKELSFIAICDGVSAIPLATSEDHKRLLDDDKGPNTGGMGALSPALINSNVNDAVMKQVIYPALSEMKKNSIPYCGFLYAGIIIDKLGNINVLEFNCRMGDPEAQVILPRLRCDLFPILEAAALGKLSEFDKELSWDERSAVGVVMAAENYPLKSCVGEVIKLPENTDKDAMIFHAGTTWDKRQLVTNGGRILTVVGMGHTISMARKTAYDNVSQISFKNSYCRTDIPLNYTRSQIKN